MSPTTAKLHQYVTTLTGAGSTADMQTIAYIVGGALILFAVTGIWRSLNSRY